MKTSYTAPPKQCNSILTFPITTALEEKYLSFFCLEPEHHKGCHMSFGSIGDNVYTITWDEKEGYYGV